MATHKEKIHKDLANEVSEVLRDNRIDVDRMNYFEIEDFLRRIIGSMRKKPVAMKVKDLISNPTIQDSQDMFVVVNGDNYGYIAVTPSNVRVIDVTQNNVYEGDDIDFLDYDASDPRNDDDGMDIYGGRKAILIDNKGGGGGE